MSRTLQFSFLESHAKTCGLELVGALSFAEAEGALQRRARSLTQWQDQGFAASMSYMKRDPQLFLDPRNFLSGGKSIISFVVSYYQGELPSRPKGCGRIARYAWGEDYHRVLRDRLKTFIGGVIKEIGDSEQIAYQIFSDAVPLLERVLASESNLGFIGKNSMLIRPRWGSYTFLAEVLWNVEIIDDRQQLSIVFEDEQLGSSCKRCTRCLTACPTNAFVAPGVLNSSRCISYLTIEKRGEFSEEEQRAIGEWLFGCDICQEVCPFNHSQVEKLRIKEFSSNYGVGPFLDLLSILKIRNDHEFQARFGKTPLMRTGRSGLIRNACAVVSNMNYTEAINSLVEVLEEDSTLLARKHAKFALERLSKVAEGIERRTIQNVLRKGGGKDDTKSHFSFYS